MSNQKPLENHPVRSPFSDGIGFGVVFEETIQRHALLPAELSVAPSGQSAERRRSFELGRAAARAALNQIGFLDSPVLRTPSGAPAWPSDVCGSISHTFVDGKCRAIAAAARRRNFQALGIDIEAIRTISARVIDRISNPAEIDWTKDVSTIAESDRRALYLFSARESLFKALAPVYGKSMRYTDTVLRWNDALSAFDALTALPGFTKEPIRSAVAVRDYGQVIVTGVALTETDISRAL